MYKVRQQSDDIYQKSSLFPSMFPYTLARAPHGY